jgi:hypothetical protein
LFLFCRLFFSYKYLALSKDTIKTSASQVDLIFFHCFSQENFWKQRLCF